ncbi:branched-chain amino acid ABC transporter permease [Pseudoroseicyclus sp. CXY001]|uniref:branched-chain amino acid ABC transporter permease n=1 Tax=Pseudoroseicyclus sp. CXY001 TaxID=3242492 RepID=UPI0035714BD8
MSDTQLDTSAAKKAFHAEDRGYSVSVGTPTFRIAMVVFALLVVGLIVAPGFVGRSGIRDLMQIMLLIGLAQCWNLLAGYGGLISVGQQAFVGLGAYFMFYCIIYVGMDPLIAVIAATVGGAIISVPIGLLTFRMQGAYFAVMTWVVAEVFRILASIYPGLGGGTGTGLPRAATSEMFGIEATATLFDMRSSSAREVVIYWAMLAAMLIVVFGSYWMLRSRRGLALMAIKDDEVAAESVGVDITRSKFIVYIFAGAGAALFGALYHLQKGGIDPNSAFSVIDWTAYVIFIVVIGGLGTVMGPIVGAIVFVLLQNYLSDFGPWYLMILGGLAIVMMLFAPQGLWGIFTERTGIELFPTRRRLSHTDGKDRQ